MREAETRAPFNKVGNSFSFARRRATDLKNNSRVHFPRKAKSLETESVFQAMRIELMGAFKTYIHENCAKGGKQAENLTKSQSLGLKSLKKRISDGEIVILPTDKSGNFAVMSRDNQIWVGAY